MLDRRTGDSALRTHLDQVWLAPGFSYAEQHVGTNGIGTALEGRRPGRGLRPRALRRAPRGPGLRRRADPAPGHRQAARRRRPDLLARATPDPMMVAAATTARPADRGGAARALRSARARPAARLPHRLPARPRRRARRQRRPADDERPGARADLDPADQAALLAAGHRGAHHRRPAAPGHRPAQRRDRAGAVPAELARTAPSAGGVIQVQLARASAGAARVDRSAHRRRAAGRGRLRHAVDEVLPARSTGTSRSGEWLVLEGEPGTGKTASPAATHQARRRPATCGCSTPPRTSTGPRVGRGDRSRSCDGGTGDAACSPTSTGCRRRRCGRSSTCSSRTASRPTSTRPWVVATTGRLPVGRATSDLAGLLALLPAHGGGAAAAPPHRGRAPSWCRT